jgi:hypothetical protein
VLWLGCAAKATPETQIPSLVHDWFGLLETRAPEPSDLERFLAEPPFELTGADGRVLGIPELRERSSELHSTYVQIEHRIDEIRVEPAGDDLYRARFEVERYAVDAEGTPHLARKQASWLVRADAHAPPVILRIDERPILAFPGTGPQVVCY